MTPPPTGSSAASAASGGATARARTYLLDLLDPLVTDAGYDLEDVTVAAAGRRSLVRVIVDADGGIDLDAVATVSRIVSDALDADVDDPASPRALAGAYVLEVTSPGVDRPLTEPRHWRRAKGRLVEVDVAGRQVRGRVVDADDAGVTLEIDGAPSRPVGWVELGRGRVQVEFNRHGAEDDAPQQDGEAG